MEWLTSPETWIALLTLTVLEIVLGIDNIIFISILAGKLPAGEQPRARTVGLTLAMVTRILLLLSDRKSTRLNSSHSQISYAVFCLNKKKDLRTSSISSRRQSQRPNHATSPA